MAIQVSTFYKGLGEHISVRTAHESIERYAARGLDDVWCRHAYWTPEADASGRDRG